MGAQLDRFRRVGAYDVAFRLEENRWNGTVAPQLVVRRVFETRERYPTCARGLPTSGGSPPQSGAPRPQAIFTELGLDGDGAAWRSLLESRDVPCAARRGRGRGDAEGGRRLLRSTSASTRRARGVPSRSRGDGSGPPVEARSSSTKSRARSSRRRAALRRRRRMGASLFALYASVPARACAARR